MILTPSLGSRTSEDQLEDQPNTTYLSPSLNAVKNRKPIFSASLPMIGTERYPMDDENPARQSSIFITTNNSGTKRSRVITPAANKVIDDEDEPRVSPLIRHASLETVKQEKREPQRKVLGEIENN
jgi:hypothetical protein